MNITNIQGIIPGLQNVQVSLLYNFSSVKGFNWYFVTIQPWWSRITLSHGVAESCAPTSGIPRYVYSSSFGWLALIAPRKVLVCDILEFILYFKTCEADSSIGWGFISWWLWGYGLWAPGGGPGWPIIMITCHLAPMTPAWPRELQVTRNHNHQDIKPHPILLLTQFPIHEISSACYMICVCRCLWLEEYPVVLSRFHSMC